MSCTSVLQRGQSGDGLCEALTLCMIEGIVVYLLFELGLVRHCVLVSDASGLVACICLFIFLLLRYAVTTLVCKCLMCASVTFLEHSVYVMVAVVQLGGPIAPPRNIFLFRAPTGIRAVESKDLGNKGPLQIKGPFRQ